MTARAIIAAVSLLVLTAASASAAEVGEVGGMPSDTSSALPKGKAKAKRFGVPRATSPPIVIGVADTTAGRVELVAQNSTKGLCLSSLAIDDFTVIGACRTSRPQPGAIEPIAWAISRFPRRVHSSVTGLVAPGVASMTVALESRGKRRHVLPAIATPDATILARLGVSEPFSYFHADYRGCIPPHKTITFAYDSAGLVTGSDRGRRFPRGFLSCERTEPHTSSGSIFYADDIRYTLFDD
jgi:hypothetical protein